MGEYVGIVTQVDMEALYEYTISFLGLTFAFALSAAISVLSLAILNNISGGGTGQLIAVSLYIVWVLGTLGGMFFGIENKKHAIVITLYGLSIHVASLVIFNDFIF